MLGCVRSSCSHCKCLLTCPTQGWQPSEEDMSKVVAIHNTVNERAWQHILAWEALHACDCATPRLKRFQGKPNQYSPKARLLNFMVRGQQQQQPHVAVRPVTATQA